MKYITLIFFQIALVLSASPKHKVDISIVKEEKNSSALTDEVIPNFLEDTLGNLLDGVVKLLGWDKFSNSTNITLNEDTKWDEIFNVTSWSEKSNATDWDEIFNMTTKEENSNFTISDESRSNENSSEIEILKLEILPGLPRSTRMIDYTHEDDEKPQHLPNPKAIKTTPEEASAKSITGTMGSFVEFLAFIL